MATPTPGKLPAQIAATPPVSTPFSGSHLAAFSPRGLKSVVPSPQQFKKSPANSNTIYGHPTNSAFGAINFDSPTTAAALGMVPQLSDLAMDASGTIGLGALHSLGRGDEDEQKRKLQQVVEILKSNKGRVGEEGIERLSRRVGLECLWETQMSSGGSTRTLIIAGMGLALDIDFTNNIVEKVSLSFPDSPEIVTKHANNAGKILLHDLQLAPGETPLTKMLDKFAVNLERLAALDKLSVMPNLNCYEAVAGIYESLKRLHEWEMARLEEEEGNTHSVSHEDAVKAVLCSKSGRPVMNARGNIGLSLDYWQEKHIISTISQGASRRYDEKDPKTWSLIVECVHSSALVYPSVRVSEKWIAEDIQKADPTADDLLLATSGTVLDWQEPNSILLPAPGPLKGEGMMEGIEQESSSSIQKLPDVMFIAKFSPPLVVPYGVAVHIHNSTGATLEAFQLSTFDSFLFPQASNEKPEADGSHRRFQRQRSILTFDKDGLKTQKIHKNTLTVHKIESGWLLTEIPFSHPRQLVDMLPTLRQYTRLSALLDRSFGSYTEEISTENGQSNLQQTVVEQFSAFMTESIISVADSSAQLSHLPIDVSLYTQPVPSFRLTFPFQDRTADISFDVGTNGTLTVTAQNVLDESCNTNRKVITEKDLGKMLEVAEDFNVFAEFIRSRLG